MSDAKTPADFLKSIKGQKVLVKLNTGGDYRGIMSSLDGYMHIAMSRRRCAFVPLKRPRGARGGDVHHYPRAST